MQPPKQSSQYISCPNKWTVHVCAVSRTIFTLQSCACGRTLHWKWRLVYSPWAWSSCSSQKCKTFVQIKKYDWFKQKTQSHSKRSGAPHGITGHKAPNAVAHSTRLESTTFVQHLFFRFRRSPAPLSSSVLCRDFGNFALSIQNNGETNVHKYAVRIRKRTKLVFTKEEFHGYVCM